MVYGKRNVDKDRELCKQREQDLTYSISPVQIKEILTFINKLEVEKDKPIAIIEFRYNNKNKEINNKNKRIYNRQSCIYKQI